MGALMRETVYVIADKNHDVVMDAADEMIKAGWELVNLDWQDTRVVAVLSKKPVRRRKTAG